MNLRKLLTVIIFVASLLLTSNHVYAEPDLSLEGSNSFSGAVGASVAIDDLQITGTPDGPVPVKLLVTNGTLQMSVTTGLTFRGPSTGSELYFEGDFADINNALATLTYTRGSEGTDTLEVSLVEPGEVFFSDNGHLYEYISDAGDWNSARTKAQALSRYGAQGYLATITSANENAFVTDRLAGAGWMGASDVASEGDWKWVTGPETGESFWSGDENGSVVPGQYENWNDGEPNDSSSNEDCGQFLAGGTGRWNDLPCSGSLLNGYVAEFGSTGDLPTVVAKDISLLTNNPPILDDASPADESTNQSVDLEIVLEFSETIDTNTFAVEISPCHFGNDNDECAIVTPVWSNGDQTVTISIANGPYRENSTYIFSLITVQDTNGADLEENFELTFSTGGDAYTITEIEAVPEVIYENEATYFFTISGVGEYSYISEPCGGDSQVVIDDEANPKEFKLSHLKVEETYQCEFGVQNLAGTSTVMVGPFTVKKQPTTASSITYSCKDPQARNYSQFGRHKSSLCIYDELVPLNSIEDEGSNSEVSTSINSEMCSQDKLLTQNLKVPSRNGSFNTYTGGIVTEAKILQQYLNALGFEAGPEDGILGPLSLAAIKRMQISYGTLADGYVGPITRGLLNQSCK